MNIDDLLTDLHRDQMLVTSTLRSKLDEQRDERHAASLELIATLKDHIRELKEQSFLLLPEGGMADLHRKERREFDKERREKELSLAHERIQLLRDLQPALMYDLHLTREEVEEEQSNNRMNGAFYES